VHFESQSCAKSCAKNINKNQLKSFCLQIFHFCLILNKKMTHFMKLHFIQIQLNRRICINFENRQNTKGGPKNKILRIFISYLQKS
jgi:hypothetical protein